MISVTSHYGKNFHYLATLLMGRETTKRMLPTIRDLPVSEEEDDQKTTPLLNIKEKIG